MPCTRRSMPRRKVPGTAPVTAREYMVAKRGFPVSSLNDVVSSASTALGFGKYGGEIITGLAKDGVFNKYDGKFGLSNKVASR
jgi:hypothetical protein